MKKSVQLSVSSAANGFDEVMPVFFELGVLSRLSRDPSSALLKTRVEYSAMGTVASFAYVGSTWRYSSAHECNGNREQKKKRSKSDPQNLLTFFSGPHLDCCFCLLLVSIFPGQIFIVLSARNPSQLHP